MKLLQADQINGIFCENIYSEKEARDAYESRKTEMAEHWKEYKEEMGEELDREEWSCDFCANFEDFLGDLESGHDSEIFCVATDAQAEVVREKYGFCK